MYSDIIEFICEAKKSVYTSTKQYLSSPLTPNSNDLLYKDRELLYINSRLGSESFSGQETVWKNELPVWSLVYFGRSTSHNLSWDFLKEALALASPTSPYRGPGEHSNKDYSYKSSSSGDFTWFQGEEFMFYKNKKVYECIFSGGIIK